MKDSLGEAKKPDTVQAKEVPQQATRVTVVERPAGMPNPVKGLKLSLYPMTKQH